MVYEMLMLWVFILDTLYTFAFLRTIMYFINSFVWKTNIKL